MVLPYPVGRERGPVLFAVYGVAVLVFAFGAALLLFWLNDAIRTGRPDEALFLFGLGATAVGGLAALGLYIAVTVWRWQAHSEVYRQFELEREDRKKGTLWYVLGVIGIVLGGPFMRLYDWIWMSNLRHVRRRLGLLGGITPARFLMFNITADVIALVLGISVRIAEPTPEEIVAGDWEWFLWASLGLFVLGLLLPIAAWVQAQRSTNALWRLGPRLLWYRGEEVPGMPNLPRPGMPPAVAAQAFPRPPPIPVGTGSGPARHLRCPRCGTLIATPLARPRCPTCGYGGPAPPPRPA